MGTVAIDASLEGAPGKYAAIGNGIVQLCLDHETEPKYGTDQQHGNVRNPSQDVRSLRSGMPSKKQS